jgi:FkbM family methyltransferase
MKFHQKVGVLLRHPDKLAHYIRYSRGRLFSGRGIAHIPDGGRIATSNFSEYLSVFGLMPTVGERAMIRKLTSSATEVFDIGANVGVWTVLLNKANPNARIHSFEPNPLAYALLQENVRRNGCANVVLNQSAVSNVNTTLNLQVPGKTAIFGRIAPPSQLDPDGRFANSNFFTVQTIRLSEYCAIKAIKQIDFLKIDVEGYEFAALRGLEPLLSQRKVKAMYMETMKENHDRMGTDFGKLLEFINGCGYRFHTVADNGEPGPAVAIDQIKAHNHLCLPS